VERAGGLLAGPGGQAIVPELEGRSLEVAISALEPIGLTVLEQQEHDAQVPAGLVTRTEPAAGTRVAKQSEVTVFVSLGPKQVLVPDPVGLSLDEAKEVLVSSGLTPGNVTSFYAATEEARYLPSRSQLEPISMRAACWICDSR
jgi:eukaryotic-like serine/threonine-protein kinase